jgi:hypothetical protein
VKKRWSIVAVQVMTDQEIWFDGAPAEAIQAAVSQQKIFLVWIHSDDSQNPESSETDDAEESSSDWSSLWTHPEIKPLLLAQSINLNLTQNSPNAEMFLQSISSPTNAVGVWLIFSGQVLASYHSAPTVQVFLSFLTETVKAIIIQRQLAARRAAMDVHKAAHGSLSRRVY